MDVKQDIDSRKAKGCSHASDYSRMAMQGGHKDLLKIDENKPVANKVGYQRTGGDWFEHNNNNNNNNNNNINNNAPTKTTKTPTRPTSAAGRRTQGVQINHRNQSNGILPAGVEQSQKVGKKRFEAPATQRSEAPFATYF